MTDTFYRIFGNDFPVLHRDGTLTDLDTILSRLNDLEALAGLSPSEWRAAYGRPYSGRHFHLALDHPTLGPTYLPEACNTARAALGLAAWNWQVYRPGGSPGQAANIASDRGNLELLQALPRIATGSAARYDASWSFTDPSLTWTPSASTKLIKTSAGTNFGNNTAARADRNFAHYPIFGGVGDLDSETGDPETYDPDGADRADINALVFTHPALSDLETAAAEIVTRQPWPTWHSAASGYPGTPTWTESYSAALSLEFADPVTESDSAGGTVAQPANTWTVRSAAALPTSRAEFYAAAAGEAGPAVWLAPSLDFGAWIAANKPTPTLIEAYESAVANAEAATYTEMIGLDATYHYSFHTIGAYAQQTLTTLKALFLFSEFFLPENWPDDVYTND